MEVAVKGKAKRRHLNAEECVGLGRSTAGMDPLTKPPVFNQRWGSRDPNRGLYPKNSTKRWKCALGSTSGSSSGQQKDFNYLVPEDIDDTSLLANTFVSETEVKEEQEEEEEEEEEEEVDDDDDVSLLAAVIMPEVKEEQVVDYLEGVSAEMFGEDDQFDKSDNDNHNEEEELEALPDAHYGLLGSSRVLLQPQGCMDDLPEEVLRQVLCFLPSQDLYRNVILVCRRWRNIVQDTKFVPYKKQYFRYMMGEDDTVLEVNSILKNSSITDPAFSQHSIRSLVVLMAQHKVREWVRPVDILESVKKHRLFSQAEASIRLRIPVIQKCFNLGIVGPNPYAAMALILILSESVGDVQDLVSLLSGCLSHTSISEYLSHMAMMLLGLKKNKIQISNRVHYNIYYVLHLMENGPFSVSSSASGWSQIHLTGEQQQILSHDIQKDHVVKIIAFAGTGKTTTLVRYAEQRPHLRFLYVAFNKSVAREAQRRFPSNVDCKTAHSLAFCDVGWRYRSKLTFNLKPFSINSVLPEGRGGYAKAKVVTTTLNTFMASTDPTITTRHVPSTHVTNSGVRHHIDEREKQLFVYDAQKIWNKMKDLKETSVDGYYMTHDGYLKLWQLQNPKRCLSDQYDVLFIDEAQDCTPAIMDVMLSQPCGKILVGDPHQQIYTFKGAVNALHVIDQTHIYYLTQSFRFGAEIAYVGATILEVGKRVQKILVGGNQKGGVCDETASKAAEVIGTGVSLRQGTTAILSRCNLTVFSEAVDLTDANPQCRLHFIGDVKNIGLNRILDIWRLMEFSRQSIEGKQQPPPKLKDPLIRSFTKKNGNAFWALKKYIKQTEDLELGTKLNIVEKYGSRVPELVMRLERCDEKDMHKADFIVGTVHKAKGLEFDTVMVTDDFQGSKVPSSRHNLDHHLNFSFDNIPDDEWNLLYVAVTRARTSLIITRSIRHIITFAGEYFLKSEMPSSLMKVGEPLPCSIPNCPNCITPGSAFIMCKQPMRCTDHMSKGGPLCERCVWTRVGPTAFLMTDDVLSMAAIPQRLDAPMPHIMLLELF